VALWKNVNNGSAYILRKGQKYLYSLQWKAVVRVNLWQTTKPSNKFEQYIGHINRLCRAADSKN